MSLSRTSAIERLQTMTKLILIRHGETNYTRDNRYCGFSDPSLNEKGIRQSKKLSQRLKQLKVNIVYSSNLRRAKQTAKIVFKNILFKEIADFREMNFGEFEGLKYNEVIKKNPLFYKNWIDDPEKIVIPGGEKFKKFVKRVRKGLSQIITKNTDRTISLVAHGGPIRIILCDALGLDLKKFWQIKQETGALNIIDYHNKTQAAALKINDISHLFPKETVSL